MSQTRSGRFGNSGRRFAAAAAGLVTSMAAIHAQAQWAAPSELGRSTTTFTAVAADASATSAGVTWTSQPTSTQTELWSALLGSAGTWAPSLVLPTLVSPDSAVSPNMSLDASGSALVTWAQMGAAPPSLWYSERPATASTWNAPTAYSTFGSFLSPYGYPMTDMNARGDAVSVWAEGTAYYYAVKWAGGSWGLRTPLTLSTAQPYSRLIKVKMGDSGDALLQWEGYSTICRTRPPVCTPTGLELNIARLAQSSASWQMSGPLAGPQVSGNPYIGYASLMLDASGRAAVVYNSPTSILAMTQGGNGQSWAAPKTLLASASVPLAAGDNAGRVTVVSYKTGEIINGDLAAGTWSAPQPLVGYVVPSGPPMLAVGANGTAVLSSGNFAAIRPTATAPWGAFSPLTSEALEQKTTTAVAVRGDGKAVVAMSALDRPANQFRLFAVTGTDTGVADPVLPAPTNVTAVGKTTGSIALTWTDNARGSPVSLERCADAGCTSSTVLTQAATTSFIDTIPNSIPGATYTYRLRSVGTTSGTTASAYVSVSGKTLPPPAAPTNLTAANTEPGVVTLNWSNNATGSYAWITTEYAFCQGVGCTTFITYGVLGTNGNGPGRVSGTPGSTYTYKVRTYTDQGYSEYSNAVTVTYASTVPAPSGIAATAVSSAQINVTLDSVYDTTTYGNYQVSEIERCAGVGCTNFALIGTMVNAPRWANYPDAGLAPGTSYSYRFRVNTSLGYSLYSTIATAVTPAGPVVTPPAAPGSLTAVASRTSVTLNWADKSNNEDLFQLERCQGSGCTAFALVQQLNPNVTTATDSFLKRSTNYRYRVRAINAAGASAYSNEVAVKTK